MWFDLLVNTHGMSRLTLNMMATRIVVSLQLPILLTPLWFGTSSSTGLWLSFNSLPLHLKQRELESTSGQKQENLLTSVHDKFFFLMSWTHYKMHFVWQVCFWGRAWAWIGSCFLEHPRGASQRVHLVGTAPLALSESLPLWLLITI